MQGFWLSTAVRFKTKAPNRSTHPTMLYRYGGQQTTGCLAAVTASSCSGRPSATETKVFKAHTVFLLLSSSSSFQHLSNFPFIIFSLSYSNRFLLSINSSLSFFFFCILLFFCLPLTKSYTNIQIYTHTHKKKRQKFWFSIGIFLSSLLLSFYKLLFCFCFALIAILLLNIAK